MIYYFMLMAFITTPLIGMDVRPVPSPPLIKEVIGARIAPCLTLQEMSRFKRTCKEHNKVVDTESLLKSNCYALNHLFNDFPYDFRSEILGHFAIAKNNQMFVFLRNKEKDLRDLDIFDLHNWPKDYSEEQLIELCAKKYSSPKELQKIRLWQIAQAAQLGSNSTFAEFLKKILPGSGFNIWDIKNVSSKKLLSTLTAKQKTKKMRATIIKNICILQDAELLLAITGNIVEPRAFKYVFWYSEKSFIEALREKNAFIEDVPDKNGNCFANYLNSHIPPSVRASTSRSYGNLIH